MILGFIGDGEIRPLLTSWVNGFSMSFFFYFLVYLPFLAGGFYFSLKKRKKFFYPLLFCFIPLLPFFLLPIFIIIFGLIAEFFSFDHLINTISYRISCFERWLLVGPQDCSGCIDFRINPDIAMISFSFYSLILSILIIKAFYSKKARLFFIIAGILIISFLVGSVGSAYYSTTTLNSKLCELIQKTGDEFDADDCFISLSLRTKNSSFCEMLSDKLKVGECYQAFFFTTGKYKNILEKCGGLYSANDECFKDAALEQKNIELCKAIINVDPRHECEKEVKMSIALESNATFESCKTLLDKKSQEKCIKETTYKLNDFNLCQEILGKVACENYFFAIKLNNPDACKESETCTLLHLEEENRDVCIPSQPTFFSEYIDCIVEIAINNNNPQLCLSSFDITVCIIEFAVRTKNPEICNYLKDPQDYEICMGWFRNE